MIIGKNKEDKQNNYTIFQNTAFALKNIWKSDKSYYLSFIPRIILNVFLPLALIYYPKLLIDLIMNKNSDTQILSVIAVYSLILVIAGIVQECVAAKFNSVRYTFAIMYQDLCDIKFKSMDYENTENPKVLDMKTHTYSGSMAAENMAETINDFLINMLGIFTYGSIIILINPLILVLLIVSTAIKYFMMSYVRKWNDKNRDNWTHLDRRIAYLFNVSQDYDRAKDIRIYKMKSWLESLTQYYQNLRMGWSKKSWNKSMLSSFVDGLLRFIRDGVAYAVLIYMLLNNKVEVGTFVFYFGAIAGFSGWLSSIIGQYNSIASYSTDINRLRIFLEVEDKFNHSKGLPLPDKSQIPYSIEMKNISYIYPGNDTPVINNMSLTINAGEKLAIVGLNGAGKTTFVKLLCGLYYPTSGDIIINGKNAKSYNINEYYTQFAVVFQEINIIPVTIARFVSGSGENVDRDKVLKSLSLVGLDNAMRKLPNGIDTTLVKGIYDDGIDLSGGEKQKLVLARALYKDAPVIILDEPTAALDPIAESELYQKYSDITDGKTSIYISHRLASTRFCNRIIFMQNGHIAECGSHDELMKKNGLYANMFNIQGHYYKEDVDEK